MRIEMSSGVNKLLKWDQFQNNNLNLISLIIATSSCFLDNTSKFVEYCPVAGCPMSVINKGLDSCRK